MSPPQNTIKELGSREKFCREQQKRNTPLLIYKQQGGTQIVVMETKVVTINGGQNIGTLPSKDCYTLISMPM